MRFFKHKNMRDVCFASANWKKNFWDNTVALKGDWVNTAGMVGEGDHFVIDGTFSKIEIPLDLFNANWQSFSSVKEARAWRG